ncbi:MAG: hypothetical protein K6A38_03715 [Lachnospiraceae bacterium]|nr:hypothetical protein [Lachnospiraceae bacterium]
MRLEYKPDGQKADTSKDYTENALKQGVDMQEQILTQTMKMKDRPFKEKFSYFMDYYKWAVLGVVVGLAIIISIVKAIVTNKDYCFVAMMVNSSNINSEVIGNDFGAYAGLDIEKYLSYVNTNEVENLQAAATSDYGVATRFAALLSTGDLDCVVYDSIIFNNKAVNGVFFDLTTVLPSEDIEKFKDRFYYVDNAVLKKIAEDISFEDAYNVSRGTYEEQLEDLKFHTDPSAMEDPVPVGIIVEDSPLIKGTDSYFELIPVFAIPQNTSRLDTAISFLHFLYDETVDASKYRLY